MSETKRMNWAVKIAMRGLAVIFVLAMVLHVLPQPVYARDLRDVQNEIEEKKKLMDQLEAKLNANLSNKQAAEEALAEYTVQYNQLLFLIDEQEAIIELTAEQLDNKSQQLNDTIESIQQNRELYESRLRAIYDMNSSNAMMATLLNVSSFSEMIQAADAMQRVSRKDTELLQSLVERREQCEAQKAELEASIAQLTEELNALEENRSWCIAKRAEMQALIDQANYNIQLTQQQTEQTEEEIKALQEEYARIFKELQQKGSQRGDGSVRYDGPMAWPVPGYSRVSSWFGDPRSNTRGHYGIDIPAPTGTPIVAVGNGTVITSEWHYSYGYYIVVDHGQGLRTLYAHCSRLDVGVGNYVLVGQQIALMGNTGNSYGSHLHIEVHEHGSRQDPAGPDYLGIY